MITTTNLTKSFGSRHALRNIDLMVGKGECLAVIGPNGAGKTTLIKVLSTIVRPTTGNATLAGFDISTHPIQVRRKIGVINHQPLLYQNLTPYENLKFYAKMYDVPNLENRIHEVTDQVGLTDRIHQQVSTLSRGMQQRFSIARALLHNPSVLLLDEPQTGLDPHSAIMLVNLLKKLISENHTVLMTTHNLQWCLQLAHRVVILHHGRIVCQESTDNLSLTGLQDIYSKYTGVSS